MPNAATMAIAYEQHRVKMLGAGLSALPDDKRLRAAIRALIELSAEEIPTLAPCTEPA